MEYKKIKIDTNEILKAFKTGALDEVILTEGRVARTIVDLLNDAEIKAEMIYQDTDFSVYLPEYQIKSYISFIQGSDDPVSEFMKIIMEFSDDINSTGQFRSWISYSNGECFLHMKEMTVEEEEKLEQEDEQDKQGY